jgi:FkbM family methyltransferase
MERISRLISTPASTILGLWQHGFRPRPTFSQFGEDVAIRKLLNPQHSGTYVDVGAHHPFKGSNTAFLYLLGWKGLVVEPNPTYAPIYKKRRPRDVYVIAGVAETESQLEYFEFGEDVLNTFSAERAERLKATRQLVRKQTIACRPLYDLVKEHLGETHVDLLSVDCEGLDLAVLRSARLELLKPTVLVIEDFQRYYSFRDGKELGAFDEFLRDKDYSPIFQSAWSAIYVFNRWRDALHTGAFQPPLGLRTYMPAPDDDPIEPSVQAREGDEVELRVTRSQVSQ